MTEHLEQFRERLLTELLAQAPATAVATTAPRRPVRRRMVLAAAAAGLAIAATGAAALNGGLAGIRFFGDDTAQPAPTVAARDIAAWWAANPPGPAADIGTPNLDAMRVLVRAEAPGGELRVYATTTSAPDVVCMAVTRGSAVVAGDCLLGPPPDAVFRDGRDLYGGRIAYPVRDVAVAFGYLPSTATGVQVRTAQGTALPVGRMGRMWVGLFTADALGAPRLDIDHGSKTALTLEARDAAGRVVYRVGGWGV